MKKQLFLTFLFIFFLSFTDIKAQDATPTPTPTPKTVVQPEKGVGAEKKTPDELKAVDDKQNVQPENLKAVPQIAPNFESEDRSLPDLGLVGVDMMQQKPLSLKEAITLALENNKDIEVSSRAFRETRSMNARQFRTSAFSARTGRRRTVRLSVTRVIRALSKNSERLTARNLIIRESERTIQFRF